MHKQGRSNLPGTVGDGRNTGCRHGTGNTLSPSPFALLIPDLLFPPPGFSASLCQRPQKFLETLSGLWPRNRPGSGGGWGAKGFLLVICPWGSLSWQSGDGVTCGQPGTGRLCGIRGGWGMLLPELSVGEWARLSMGVWCAVAGGQPS